MVFGVLWPTRFCTCVLPPSLLSPSTHLISYRTLSHSSHSDSLVISKTCQARHSSWDFGFSFLRTLSDIGMTCLFAWKLCSDATFSDMSLLTTLYIMALLVSHHHSMHLILLFTASQYLDLTHLSLSSPSRVKPSRKQRISSINRISSTNSADHTVGTLEILLDEW